MAFVSTFAESLLGAVREKHLSSSALKWPQPLGETPKMV